MSDSRIIELILLAHREGFELPMPASEIIALEDEGHLVNLTTGEVIRGGADESVEVTVVGEDTVRLLVFEAR